MRHGGSFTDASGARSWDRRNVGPSGHSISIWKQLIVRLVVTVKVEQWGGIWWLASSWRVQAGRVIAAAPRATARLSVLCSLTDITVLTSLLSRRTSALRHKPPFQPSDQAPPMQRAAIN